MPLSLPHTHTHSFEEPFWCYYSMIVIQHWMRQFDVGAEWCSPSHCGSGLEYRTQFQTHVSVIYRSAFHHPAVQGLRNACTALPGLSACRLCPPLLASDRHTLSHWCMHKCTHTQASSAYARVFADTHAQEDEPLSSITHRRDYPMITLLAPSSPASALAPWKTFAPLQAKKAVISMAVVVVVMIMMMTTPHFSSFPKQLFTSFQLARRGLPAELTCNLKQNIK